MRVIPKKIRAEMAADPYYYKCARQEIFHDHVCQPNPVTRRMIEWEHALIYAGQQIIDKWATVPLCWYVHEGPGKDKNINRLLALRQATLEDFAKYPRANFSQQLSFLEKQYEPKLFATAN